MKGSTIQLAEKDQTPFPSTRIPDVDTAPTICSAHSLADLHKNKSQWSDLISSVL